MSDSDGHGDFGRYDLGRGADDSGTRQQQGRAPLDDDASRAREVRRRERAVSAADYERLATPGFPSVGRATVAAVFGVAALVLSAWLLSQLHGPRQRTVLATVARDKAAPAGKHPGQDAAHDTVRPAPSPTEEPAPLSPTPAPELTVNFNADAYAIERGECTNLRWVVTGAENVFLLGQEAEATGAEQVCPDETTGYTLMAENGSEEVREHFEITVVEPVDDAPGCTPEPNDPCPN